MNNSDLECVNKIDFTKGFSSFHIKWKINISEKKNIRSDEFTTKFQNGVASFYIVFEKEEDNTSGFYFESDDDVLTALIIRLAVYSANQEDPYYNKSYFFIFRPDRQDGYGARFTLDETKLISSGGDFVLHCWIDIPNLQSSETNDVNIDKNLVDNSFCLKSVSDLSINFKDLFDSVLDENSKMAPLSDVTLVIMVKDNPIRKFYSHRNILASRSSIFCCMFTTEWKEGTNREVEIEDIDEKVKEYVLRYIYTGRSMRPTPRPSSVRDWTKIVRRF